MRKKQSRQSSSRSRNASSPSHGGWFGDSEGHAEARRGRSAGYEGSPRSSRYDHDDDNYGRSSREGYGQRGWFGDSEGHAESARQNHGGRSVSSDYGYDDDNGYSRSNRGGHGEGGWFGNSEGHAEAARQNRGGRSMSNRDYDDEGYGYNNRSRSSSRYEDDEDNGYYGRGGRSHGGWFGASQGHAESGRRR